MREEPLETYEFGSFTAKIFLDEMGWDPRENDNVGEILYTSSRYTLGDRRVDADEIREITEDPEAIWLPVYAYIHGGVTISTVGKGQYIDRWDGGMCGIIYAYRNNVRKMGIKPWGDHETIEDAVHAILEGEIEEYDMYLRGDVYGIVVEDENEEEIESCWGYYGWDYAREEAQRQAESYYKYFVEHKMSEELESLANDIVLDAAGNTDLFDGIVCEDAVSLVIQWEGYESQVPEWYKLETPRDELVKLTSEKLHEYIMQHSNKVRLSRLVAESLIKPSEIVAIFEESIAGALHISKQIKGGELESLSNAVATWNELLKLAVEKTKSNYQLREEV